MAVIIQYEPPHSQEGDKMSELIEKMLQEFDSGNMDAVNQILDLKMMKNRQNILLV